MLTAPTFLQRVAKEIPLIGWERSKAVEEAFSSVFDMVTAPLIRWRRIPGIGRIIAEAAYKILRQSKTERRNMQCSVHAKVD